MVFAMLQLRRPREISQRMKRMELQTRERRGESPEVQWVMAVRM
jgi:hypothetical protein